MKVEARGGMATVHAPDTARLAAMLSKLEGARRYLQKGGISIVWSGHNQDLLERYFPDADIRQISPTEAPKHSALGSKPKQGSGASVGPYGVPGGAYKPKTPDLEHQTQALAAIRAAPTETFGLFMEAGTGKTKVILDRLGELYCEGVIRKVLVLAPKGVHRQWVAQQIPKHLGVDADARAWPDHFRDKPPIPGKLAIFVINDDGAKIGKGRVATMDFIKGGIPFAFVYDESHRAKNHRSARWKFGKMIVDKPACRAAYLMTGTPIAKLLEDEWAQFNMINPDILRTKYVSTFRKRYCVMGGFDFRQVIDHVNVDSFKKLSAPYTFRVRREDLGMVPDDYTDWVFDLDPVQKEMIQDMRSRLLVEIKSGIIVEAKEAMHKILKIQQISNGWIYDEQGEFHKVLPITENPRIQAIREWIGDSDLAEQPVVVWCRFRGDIECLAQAWPTAWQYHGGVAPHDRETAVARWLADGGMFIGTPAAGGVGLNLQGRCARVGYFSQGENYVDRIQSEARVSRIGKPGPVEFTDFVAIGSHDRAVQRNLSRKNVLASKVLDLKTIVEGLENDY